MKEEKNNTEYQDTIGNTRRTVKMGTFKINIERG